MEWNITSFVSLGPVRFGMTSAEVEAILGRPSGLPRGKWATEYRGDQAPMVSYEDGKVCQIEAYYDLPGVTLQGIRLFEEDGLEVMRKLERLNGGALESVGIVLFENLGISVGRLDQPGREYHSVTAFAKGLWADRIGRLKPFSFF